MPIKYDINYQNVKDLLTKLNIQYSENDVHTLKDYAKKGGIGLEDLEYILKRYSFKKLIDRANIFNDSNIISYSDFENILRFHHFNNPYKYGEEIRELYNFFSKHNFTKADVEAVINGAKKHSILKHDNYDKFRDVKAIIEQISSENDILLLKKLNAIDKKFKEYFRNNNLKYPALENVIQDTMKTALRVTKEENADIFSYSDEVVDIMWNLACIYNSINSHIASVNSPINFTRNGIEKSFIRTVDGIMVEKINKMADINFTRLKKVYDGNKSRAEVFDDFLEALIDNSLENGEKFSEEEIRKLMLQTPSLVFSASRKKLDAARAALNMYINEVLKMIETKPTLKEFSKKLESVTTKKILLRAGTILNASPEIINSSISLLLGKSVDEITPDVRTLDTENSVYDKKAYILKTRFPELKIEDMSLQDHLNILNNHNTLFYTLNTSSMYNATNLILSYTCQGLGLDSKDIYTNQDMLESLGFNTQSLFTGNNISDVFGSRFIAQDNTSKENYIKNISLISKLVPINDLQEIIKHKFNFFIQDTKTLTEEVKNLINSSKSDQDLCKKLTNLVNKNGKDKNPVQGKKQNGDINLTELVTTLDIIKNTDLDTPQKLIVTKIQKNARNSNSSREFRNFDSIIELPEDLADEDEIVEEDDGSVITELDPDANINEMSQQIFAEIKSIFNLASDENYKQIKQWLVSDAENSETAIYQIFNNDNTANTQAASRKIKLLKSYIDNLTQADSSNETIKHNLEYITSMSDLIIQRLDIISNGCYETIKYAIELTKSGVKEKTADEGYDSKKLVKAISQLKKVQKTLNSEDAELIKLLLEKYEKSQKNAKIEHEKHIENRQISKSTLQDSIYMYQEYSTYLESLNELKECMAYIISKAKKYLANDAVTKEEPITQLSKEEVEQIIKQLESEIKTFKNNLARMTAEVKAKFDGQAEGARRTPAYKKSWDKVNKKAQELEEMEKELANYIELLKQLKSFEN